LKSAKTNINFQKLFESAPGLYLILKPDAPHFTILGASNAYLVATMTERSKITGRGLFEVFPDNPDDITADGTTNLKKSLKNVLRYKTAHTMDIQKYDVQRPKSKGGGFEERYWSPLNTPVLNRNNKVEYIIHRVEDVTEIMLLKKKGIEDVNTAKAELDKKSLFIKNNEERINTLLDALLKYTLLDFSEKLTVSDKADEIDAIAIGLNTLSEELEDKIKLLEESEEKYHNMVEEVEDYAILLLDKEGHIQNWNKGAKKIKGYDTEEVIGKNFSIFYPENALNDKLPEKQLAKAIKNGKTIDEGWRVRKDGSVFWAYVVLTALHDEKDNIIGFTKVTRDLTLLKEAEDKLLSVNKELEAFSYSVSHDLRAPLRAVNGYAEMLREDYNDKIDEEGKRIIDNIKHNATKMGTLIDDLLTFSRLGRKELQKTEINLHEIVEGTLIDINKSTTYTAKINIGNLHKVKADYGLLHQVIFNLISNAIKYSSKKEKPVIDVFSEKKKNEFIFYVKDNGAGFDMRFANKLFGVFQRLHSQEEFQGTGVGLAIVQRIIAKHGGKVWAEGEVDKGATFKFSLPVN
jgi:PAS domain S-box-containing protein